jgi:hypothetical protein
MRELKEFAQLLRKNFGQVFWFPAEGKGFAEAKDGFVALPIRSPITRIAAISGFWQGVHLSPSLVKKSIL